MTYLLDQADTRSNISFQKTTVTSSQDVTTSWVLVEGGQMHYTQLGDGYRIRETAQYQRFQSTITGRFLIPIYRDKNL